MKKKIVFIGINLLLVYVLHSQDFKGKVVYNVEFENNISNSPKPIINDLFKIRVSVDQKEEEKKEVNFHLLVNGHEALFQSEYDLPTKKKLGFTYDKGAAMSQHENIYYYNSRSKENFYQSFWTKNHLVHVDSVNWKLTNESRIIGNYLCYKAVTEVSSKQFEDMSYQSPVVAWFTPDIKLPFGVQNFNGLPGLTIQLIADHNDGKVVFTVTEINLDAAEQKIKKPIGNKNISQNDYVDYITGLRN